MMQRTHLFAAAVGLVGCLCAGPAVADVHFAVQRADITLPGNTLCQTFGYGPDFDEVFAISSGFNQSLMRAQITDDTTSPWTTDSTLFMNADDLLLWGKNGSTANGSGDPNVWGCAYNPLNGKYYVTIYRKLLDWTGSFNLAQQRIIAVLDPSLPNGTGATVSNADDNFLLSDPNATFVSDGVSVGDRPTLALNEIAGTYTVTEVIDENTLRLDRDAGSGGGVRYYLMLQPWVTLGSFRTLFPDYYGADLGRWPNTASAPGISLDGSKMYVRDSRTKTVIEASTLVPEDVSVFVTHETFFDYIDEQDALGRLKPGTTNGFINSNGRCMDEIRLGPDGRVFIVETETGDILWTTNGAEVHTFLSSEDVSQYYLANVPLHSGKVNHTGLVIDQMGTVYWGDNCSSCSSPSPRSIYKVARTGGFENIRVVATRDQIVEAIGGSAGLLNMQIRGDQVLFNEYSTDNIGAADMNTYEFGDYDGDIDADADDFGIFFTDCVVGPGVSTVPDVCTSGFPEAFDWSDLDRDGDVDLRDYAKFQLFTTGPL